MSAVDFPIRKLLTWYRQHRREMPWRPTKDRPANPYHVLVSEAMLQQTQVATVLPYFDRFVTAFPTLESLADADEQRVLKLWQGLGYYRRARNLRAAAQQIVAEHGGAVPDTVEALLKLPGVGRYTAGAIASVAHNRPAPILDGNVARVLARFDGLDTPVDQTPTQKKLWARAEQLVTSAPRGSACDFNQSLMELGALVCTPKSAKCLHCPLRNGCNALATGRVENLPVKTPKKKPVAVTHYVVAIERNGKFLFEQRPSTGLWANLWQMPTLEIEPGATTSPHSRGVDATVTPSVNLVDWVKQKYGLMISKPRQIDAFTHLTTHRSVEFIVYRSITQSGQLRSKVGHWKQIHRINDLPLAKPQQAARKSLDMHLVNTEAACDSTD